MMTSDDWARRDTPVAATSTRRRPSFWGGFSQGLPLASRELREGLYEDRRADHYDEGESNCRYECSDAQRPAERVIDHALNSNPIGVRRGHAHVVEAIADRDRLP